jgi:pyrimidine operon attenuation protein/uracil phosphoribosyltransferase
MLLSAQTPIDQSGVASAVAKLADAMTADLSTAGPIFLAGIPTRGVALARRLREELARRGVAAECGAVDIAMYRDDLGMRGGVTPLRGTDLPMDLDNWTIVLVDDVQQTGRTARAAIDAVGEAGAVGEAAGALAPRCCAPSCAPRTELSCPP